MKPVDSRMLDMCGQDLAGFKVKVSGVPLYCLYQAYIRCKTTTNISGL